MEYLKAIILPSVYNATSSDTVHTARCPDFHCKTSTGLFCCKVLHDAQYVHTILVVKFLTGLRRSIQVSVLESTNFPLINIFVVSG